MSVNEEGGVTLMVDLSVTLKDMQSWTPDRISAFFAGLARVRFAAHQGEDLEHLKQEWRAAQDDGMHLERCLEEIARTVGLSIEDYDSELWASKLTTDIIQRIAVGKGSAAVSDAQPLIYPCGCSKHKVNAGLCSLYRPGDVPAADRREQEYRSGSNPAGETPFQLTPTVTAPVCDLVCDECGHIFTAAQVRTRRLERPLKRARTSVGAMGDLTALRRLLWLRHDCVVLRGPSALYGDDGEMQCAMCLIDFKRMTATEIERLLSIKLGGSA